MGKYANYKNKNYGRNTPTGELTVISVKGTANCL
jgi:hypothetical protein